MVMYIAATNNELELPKLYFQDLQQLAIATEVSVEYIKQCLKNNEKLIGEGRIYSPPVDECKYRFEQVWV